MVLGFGIFKIQVDLSKLLGFVTKGEDMQVKGEDMLGEPNSLV